MLTDARNSDRWIYVAMRLYISAKISSFDSYLSIADVSKRTVATYLVTQPS